MNAIQKVVLAITATIIVAADAKAGRWLSHDPIQDGAGFVQRDTMPEVRITGFLRNEPNLYTFVRNNPICHVDRLGLRTAGCGKCGVKSVKLQFVGIGYDHAGYWLHLVGKAHFITSADDKRHDSTCCAVIQFAKGRVTRNGNPIPTAGTGMRLDGSWQLDNVPWRTDQADQADTVPVDSYEALDTNEFVWIMHYDRPGISGWSIGDTFNDRGSFRWKVFDRCNNWKLVKASNTVSYQVSGQWPEFEYWHTR